MAWKLSVQTYLVILHFASLHLTAVAFRNRRQDQKDYNSLYRRSQIPNSQHLQCAPILVFGHEDEGHALGMAEQIDGRTLGSCRQFRVEPLTSLCPLTFSHLLCVRAVSISPLFELLLFGVYCHLQPNSSSSLA